MLILTGWSFDEREIVIAYGVAGKSTELINKISFDHRFGAHMEIENHS